MRAHTHYLLVRPLDSADEVTSGGIVLPDQALALKRGRVLVVGSGVDFVYKGDVVLFNPLGGVPHGDDVFIHQDVVMASLPEEID